MKRNIYSFALVFLLSIIFIAPLAAQTETTQTDAPQYEAPPTEAEAAPSETAQTEATHADSHDDTIAIFKKSPVVQPFFNTSYGYAVFPNVIKAGIFAGCSYGKGKVYKNDIPVGTSSLNRMSLGFQFGGLAMRQIVFFEDERSFTEFTNGNFEFDFGVNATVVTVGAQAKAGSLGSTASASAGPKTGAQATSKYYKGMAVFIHHKGGLMLEATIGGQKFTYEPFE